MKRIDYLPLGSIVYLNDGMKKLMIVGRGLIVKNGEKPYFFDYGGVLFPEGLQGDEMAYFQHDAVKKIVFQGFKDDDDEAAVDKINLFLENNTEIERGDINNWR